MIWSILPHDRFVSLMTSGTFTVMVLYLMGLAWVLLLLALQSTLK
jgi:hypothetical protein